jgi:hypothetical protein
MFAFQKLQKKVLDTLDEDKKQTLIEYDQLIESCEKLKQIQNDLQDQLDAAERSRSSVRMFMADQLCSEMAHTVLAEKNNSFNADIPFVYSDYLNKLHEAMLDIARVNVHRTKAELRPLLDPRTSEQASTAGDAQPNVSSFQYARTLVRDRKLMMAHVSHW